MIVATRPTVDRLRELFMVTSGGLLVRRISVARHGAKKAGTQAGTSKSSKGYMQVEVDGFTTLVHRVVYAIHHGEWPKHEIDHIDGNRSNNTPANLRDVTRQVNSHNIKKAMPYNTTGLLGVQVSRDRFRARICVNGTTLNLGTFDSPEEAHNAYIKAKRDLHAGCTI